MHSFQVANASNIQEPGLYYYTDPGKFIILNKGKLSCFDTNNSDFHFQEKEIAQPTEKCIGVCSDSINTCVALCIQNRNDLNKSEPCIGLYHIHLNLMTYYLDLTMTLAKEGKIEYAHVGLAQPSQKNSTVFMTANEVYYYTNNGSLGSKKIQKITNKENKEQQELINILQNFKIAYGPDFFMKRTIEKFPEELQAEIITLQQDIFKMLEKYPISKQMVEAIQTRWNSLEKQKTEIKKSPNTEF